VIKLSTVAEEASKILMDYLIIFLMLLLAVQTIVQVLEAMAPVKLFETVAENFW
jgi:hypothetical protein